MLKNGLWRYFGQNSVNWYLVKKKSQFFTVCRVARNKIGWMSINAEAARKKEPWMDSIILFYSHLDKTIWFNLILLPRGRPIAEISLPHNFCPSAYAISAPWRIFVSYSFGFRHIGCTTEHPSNRQISLRHSTGRRNKSLPFPCNIQENLFRKSKTPTHKKC